MSKVKDTVTISEIMFGAEVENESGFKTQIININTVEPVNQFKVNEDGEKEEKQVRQLGIRMSDFTRILVLNDLVALIDTCDVADDVTDMKIRFAKQYKNQIKVLKGAKLTIEREEDKREMYDTTKPLVDEKGKPKVNEDGEPMYEPLKDAEGKVVKKLVGYTDIKYVKLELSQPAMKLAEKLVYEM